jgi:hypothetical protein
VKELKTGSKKKKKKKKKKKGRKKGKNGEGLMVECLERFKMKKNIVLEKRRDNNRNE